MLRALQSGKSLGCANHRRHSGRVRGLDGVGVIF